MDKIRLIIADYHELFLKGLRGLIVEHGDFDCVAIASDEGDTLRLTSEFTPDLLLVDMCLVKQDVTHFLSAIRASSPETRTIILTHSLNQNEIIEAFRAGVFGYLTKDTKENQLFDALHTVYSGQRVLSPVVTSVITGNGKTNEKRDESSLLSERELKLVQLTIKGKNNREIATELGISEHTVASHLMNIYRKFNVRTRIEAIMYCLAHRLITIDDQL